MDILYYREDWISAFGLSPRTLDRKAKPEKPFRGAANKLWEARALLKSGEDAGELLSEVIMKMMVAGVRSYGFKPRDNVHIAFYGLFVKPCIIPDSMRERFEKMGEIRSYSNTMQALTDVIRARRSGDQKERFNLALALAEIVKERLGANFCLPPFYED